MLRTGVRNKSVAVDGQSSEVADSHVCRSCSFGHEHWKYRDDVRFSHL